MHLRFLHKLFFLLVLVSTASATLFAQSAAGGRFLLLRPSAVSNAMGGAGAAVYTEKFSTYFNPAALALSPPAALSASYNEPLPFFDGVVHSYITASVDLGSAGAFGFSTNQYWKGTHAVTRWSAMVENVEDLRDWQYKLTYARSVTDQVSLGISLGVLGLNVSDMELFDGRKGSSTSATVDAGLLITDLAPSLVEEPGTMSHLHRGLSVALVFLNVGPRTTMIDAVQSDNIPATMLLGFAYSPYRTRALGMMVTIEMEKELYEPWMPNYGRLGAEVRVYDIVALRGGRVLNNFESGTSYWTWGAGAGYRWMHVNVARYTRALLPAWHWDATFSLELK